MTGLVGWWPLHESSGSTAYDLSGNGNHGSLNGGIVQGVAGKGGLTAYSLNKSNSEDVSIPHSSGLSLGEVSVFVWIRPRNPDANGVDGLIVKGTNTRNYQLDIDSTQGLAWYDENGGSLHSGVMPQEGEWSHVGAIFQNGTLKLYIDGELVATEEGRPSLSTSSESASIGTDNHGNFLDGHICDARIYDRPLTPNEVQTLYEWGNGDFVRSLNDSNSSSAVSRWAFDGDATDSWGGNDGSVNVGAGYGNGIRNQAKMFNGSDEYVSVSNTGVASPVTVSSWIYPFSSGGNGFGRIFDQQDDFDLALGDSNGYAILWEINDNNYWYGSNTLPKNEWHHVTASIDSSGNGKVYVNGSLLDQNNSETVNPSNNTARIGDMVSGGRKFDGRIDDLRIYSKALSPSEVFELYRWGTRGRDLRKLTVNSR